MQRLDELQRNIAFAMNQHLKFYRSKMEHLHKQLQSMNPREILNRGYSICYKDGEIIKDVAQLNLEDMVEVKLARGRFGAEVKNKGDGL
jgi:exodeoxyribonuclease VII large subunit